MSQLAKFAEKQPVLWLVLSLALIAAAVLSLPHQSSLKLQMFLPLHTAMEVFSIVVAMLIFTISINSYAQNASANQVLLSSAFLVVGLLDFGHMLSYTGMPDFVTPSGRGKAIHFWLAARWVAALALLAVAILPWRKGVTRPGQVGILVLGVFSTTAIYWVILFHPAELPRFFDPTTGLSPLKRGMEYLIVGIHAVTAIIFYRRRQEAFHPYNFKQLFAAVAIMGLGELFFAAYFTVTDIPSLLGHVYKVIAYYLLYRAIFAQAICTPYRLLSELQYRNELILNAAGDGICGLDNEGKIRFINPTGADMLGYRVEQLLGQAFHGVAYQPKPDDGHHPASACPILAALEHATHYRGEGEVFWRGDGSRFPVEYTCTPIFDRESEVCMVVTFSDISERKRTADLIADLYNNAPNGYHSLDAQGMIVHINDTELAWLGYRRDEVVGKMTLPQLLTQEGARCFHESFPLFKTRGYVTNLSQEMVRKDGSILPVLLSATSIRDKQGEFVMSRSVVIDMTERRQVERKLRDSEERFRTLFGGIQDAILVIPLLGPTATGNFIEVNDVACQMLGYPRDVLLKMTIADIDDPYDGADPAPLLERLMAGERVIFETVHRTREGEKIAVEVRATPFLLAGSPVIMSVIRDITERRRMEREARVAHQRLRELATHLETVREEEKASIAREIHDDLGGTLTALKMDLEWLFSKLPIDATTSLPRDHAKSIAQLLDNAFGVTRRIINELRPSILDDGGLFAAIEWQCEQFQKRTNIECRVSYEDAPVELNQKQSITLFRILQEALTNVIRHSGATQVDISFRHNGTTAALRISDNGRGLDRGCRDAAHHYGIRGMFERANSLDGYVRIDSPVSGGLTVIAILPLQNETTEAG